MENKKVCLDVETFLKVEELLEQIPRERMIEMGDELNRYDCWPAELEEIPSERREAHRNELRSMVEVRVGRRALLRYHHLHNLHRTEQEFEDWWEERGAWWLQNGQAAEELKELIKDALREASSKQVGQQAEEYTEKCAEKRADHDGKEFIAAILFALGLVLGTFLGVLL